jgi:hypothetical protein
MDEEIDLSKLSMRQLQALKSRIKAARPVIKYRSIVKEICELPPEKSKEILCQMAKAVEEESIKGGWQKIVLNAIKNQME